MKFPDDDLKEGLSANEAVAAFVAACNRDADRLFITESWFAPFRVRLLTALPANLSQLVVDALRDALYKRRPLEAVVQFIEQQPMNWDEFAEWTAAREQERHFLEAQAGFFPWPDVEAAEHDEELQRTHAWGEANAPAVLGLAQDAPITIRERARNCPGCGRPASELTWVYFSSPAWTWQQLCGRAGWLVVCKPCRLQTDFFLDQMN
jgi:hypothetical protein